MMGTKELNEFDRMFFPPKLRKFFLTLSNLEKLTPNLRKYVESEAQSYFLKALTEDDIIQFRSREPGDDQDIEKNQRAILETTIEWWRQLYLCGKEQFIFQGAKAKQVQNRAKRLLIEFGKALIPSNQLTDHRLEMRHGLKRTIHPSKRGRRKIELYEGAPKSFIAIYKDLKKELQGYLKRRYHNPHYAKIPPGKKEDIQKFAREKLALKVPDEAFQKPKKKSQRLTAEIRTDKAENIILSLLAYSNKGIFNAGFETLRNLLKEAKRNSTKS